MQTKCRYSYVTCSCFAHFPSLINLIQFTVVEPNSETVPITDAAELILYDLMKADFYFFNANAGIVAKKHIQNIHRYKIKL